MRCVNATPYPAAPIPGRIEFPGHSLTLVVKGTFDLSPGGVATPAADQPFPTGDEPYPEAGAAGSCRYASDFAFHKPRADLLLVGSCHPPGGTPAQRCRVGFRVGDHAKSLLVHGDRRWEGMRGFRRISEASPFTVMPLRYERSYGGADDARNPAGLGAGPIASAAGEELHPLPNLEDPAAPIRSPRDRPPPAGFGPLGATWQDRTALLGSYDDGWQTRRFPWWPEDFDYGHYNAAPRDQQMEGYLRGDEALGFENLHPQHPRYEARLPGLRVRCFLREEPPEGETEPPFHEVPMALDTLWVDMEAEQLVLVWRGWCPARSEQLADVRELFVMEERLEDAPAPLEQCRARFLETLAALDAQGAPAPAPPEAGPEPAAEAPAAEGEDLETGESQEALRARADAQVASLLASAGIDLEQLSPERREELRALQDRAFQHLFEPERAEQAERERLEGQLAESLAGLGLDPANLPAQSERAKSEQLRLIAELGVDDPAALLASPEAARMFATLGAVLPAVGLDPENLDPLIAEARRLRAQGASAVPRADAPDASAEAGESASAEDVVGTPAPAWSRERVEAAIAGRESLEHQDLHGLDLSGLDLGGMLLNGADLRACDLSGSNLRRVAAARADLSKARLPGACLAEADLHEANLSEAVLEGALLDDVLLARARLPRADLRRAVGPGASFTEADLTEARLSQGRFPGADFTGCVLAGAQLDEADLSDASLLRIACRDARFTRANLTRLRASDGSDFRGSCFAQAEGLESIWMESDLSGSDFSYARMQGANFIEATLEGANLSAADLRESRFIRARLARARMVQMNLFEGSLEKADLTEADLSGSNLYGVELLESVLAGTRLDGANLRMTKLG